MTTTGSGEVGAAYASCRGRIGQMVRAAEANGRSVKAAAVPACPQWSVHDVVAHLAGVVSDALAGNLDGVATDPWTAAQVEARRDRPVGDVLDEWDAGAATFEGLLDAIGDPGRQAVLDAVTHEHDIRGALGAPGARDTDAVRIGLSFIAPRFVEAAAATRGITVRVAADDGSVAYGSDDAPLTLIASPFELVRALTGRRSADQLRAMKWDGDCNDGVIDAFTYGPFRPAASAIEE